MSCFTNEASGDRITYVALDHLNRERDGNDI